MVDLAKSLTAALKMRNLGRTILSVAIASVLFVVQHAQGQFVPETLPGGYDDGTAVDITSGNTFWNPGISNSAVAPSASGNSGHPVVVRYTFDPTTPDGSAFGFDANASGVNVPAADVTNQSPFVTLRFARVTIDRPSAVNAMNLQEFQSPATWNEVNSTIPEPATVVLLGIVALGLIGFYRRGRA